MSRRVAVFDMNETSLDLAPVRVEVNEIVGAEGGFTVWFQRLLQLSMTVTATNAYQPFPALARFALEAVAATGGRTIDDATWSRVATAMGSLSAYPDVVGGLERLREGGWTLVALTNSAPGLLARQLDSSGLAPLFEHQISVEAVRRFKPAAAPYRHAAEVTGFDPEVLGGNRRGDGGVPWMVACHDWDLAGANAAGYATAYVARPGMSYASAYPQPDVWVDDFEALASALLA
ncbi:MAG: haloacid dehalogenase type II [Actinomycetota bacterium]